MFLKNIISKARKPKVGRTYGDYTVIFAGMRGSMEVYYCYSARRDTVYVMTAEELWDERQAKGE